MECTMIASGWMEEGGSKAREIIRGSVRGQRETDRRRCDGRERERRGRRVRGEMRGRRERGEMERREREMGEGGREREERELIYIPAEGGDQESQAKEGKKLRTRWTVDETVNELPRKPIPPPSPRG